MGFAELIGLAIIVTLIAEQLHDGGRKPARKARRKSKRHSVVRELAELAVLTVRVRAALRWITPLTERGGFVGAFAVKRRDDLVRQYCKSFKVTRAAARRQLGIC
jgi:hypothetical protein